MSYVFVPGGQMKDELVRMELAHQYAAHQYEEIGLMTVRTTDNGPRLRTGVTRLGHGYVWARFYTWSRLIHLSCQIGAAP